MGVGDPSCSNSGDSAIAQILFFFQEDKLEDNFFVRLSNMLFFEDCKHKDYFFVSLNQHSILLATHK